MTTGLVTVVTPTMPRRHDKLRRAVASLQAQSMARWEHLIVPNGRDPELDQVLRSAGHHPDADRRVRVLPLGRPHPTPGHWNRVLAGLVAETPYIAYLDDDNAYRPRHLELLTRVLEENPTADFAYGQAWYVDHLLGDPVQAGTALNHIDASMIVHRIELLAEHGTWDPMLHAPDGNAYAVDGMLVERWLSRGVRGVQVPKVTLDYLQIGYWIDGGGAS